MEGQRELDDGGQSGRATVLSLAQGLGVDFVPLSALQFLDAPDIARCGRANRFLYTSACDEGLWQEARDRLWEGKVFVLESARTLKAKAGYIASLEDSKRTWLELEELTSFSWWFRFKKQAGEAWTAQDPWYRNEKVGEVVPEKEIEGGIYADLGRVLVFFTGGSQSSFLYFLCGGKPGSAAPRVGWFIRSSRMITTVCCLYVLSALLSALFFFIYFYF